MAKYYDFDPFQAVNLTNRFTRGIDYAKVPRSSRASCLSATADECEYYGSC